MMTIDVTVDDGSNVRYGVLTIFAINDLEYAAAVPLKDDATPANADVALFACDVNEDGYCEFYEIDSEEEYNKAALAFQHIVSV